MSEELNTAKVITGIFEVPQGSSPPEPPVITSISTSSPTCSLSGSPPFTVFIDWTLSGSRPIWALISLLSFMTYRIEIRDPERNGRRIGPPSTAIGDEDEPLSDSEDVAFVRIAPDEPYRQSYTFSTQPKANGLRGSDTKNLKSGKSYDLTLRPTSCRWMYEDEMGDCNKSERKQKLRDQPVVEPRQDCRATFTAE